MNCSPQSEKRDALRVGRRDCLRIVIGAAGALCMARYDRPPRSLQADLEHVLRSSGAHVMGDATLLRQLGSLYLALHPQERDMTHLLHSLFIAHTGPGMSNSVFESIGRDWRTHDLALLDGWVLARTEARACALLHMIQGTAA
jgi:hypothetical protein